MYTAHIFQGRIQQLIDCHNAACFMNLFDEHEAGQRLTIYPPRQRPYVPRVVITTVARNVMHIATMDDHIVAEASFFTGDMGGWTPLGWRRPYSGIYTPLARLAHDLSVIECWQADDVAYLAHWCNAKWSNALRDQQYLKLTPATMQSAVSIVKPPSVYELMLR